MSQSKILFGKIAKKTQDYVKSLFEILELFLELRDGEDKSGKKPSLLGKRTKRDKDPHEPKQPPSAYLLFCIERRKKLKETHPTMPEKEKLKLIASEWSNLDEPQKKIWQDKAELLKAKYALEKKSYHETKKPMAAEEDRKKKVPESVGAAPPAPQAPEGEVLDDIGLMSGNESEEEGLKELIQSLQENLDKTKKKPADGVPGDAALFQKKAAVSQGAKPQTTAPAKPAQGQPAARKLEGVQALGQLEPLKKKKELGEGA